MPDPAPAPNPAPPPAPSAAPAPAPSPDPKGAAPNPAPAPSGEPAPNGAEPPKGAWPEDWVSRVAKGDEKRAKDFSKFASPEALADSYSALQRRLSSGEFKPTLPKNAKPEELTAWRKDNGIPEKPEAYDLTGIAVPKEDSEIIGGFLKSAHQANMTPAQARTAVQSYYAELQRQSEARTAKDDEQRQSTLDALNQEWGGGFRRNLNLIEGTILSKFPESVRELLKHARLSDGTALFNSVDALRGFAALALEINPAGIVAPASGGDIAKGMLDEWNEIQKVRVERRADYNKDAKMQERERDLIDAMIKHGLMDGKGVLIGKKAA